MGGQRLPYMDSPRAGAAGCSRPPARATLIFAPPRGRISHCVAGNVGLELRNVVAKYPFERSHRFPVIQPNSGRETIRVRAATVGGAARAQCQDLGRMLALAGVAARPACRAITMVLSPITLTAPGSSTRPGRRREADGLC